MRYLVMAGTQAATPKEEAMKTTTKAPRLSTLAQQIAEAFPFAEVTLGATTVNTDRKAGRLRIPGKGRDGKILKVIVNGKQVFSHNSAETYRCNEEVVKWLKVAIVRHAIGMKLTQYGWPFQSGMSKAETAAFNAKMQELYPED